MKYNRHTLKKIENLLSSAAYQVIYAKGSFTSGHCIVDHNNKIVVNKYLDTEGRILTLIDILEDIYIDEELLVSKEKAFYNSLTDKAESLK